MVCQVPLHQGDDLVERHLGFEGEHPLPRTTGMTTNPTPAHLDDLARRHTGFPSFGDLLVGREGYLPVLLTSRNAAKRSTTAAELRELAVAYDDAMGTAGDHRRAIR